MASTEIPSLLKRATAEIAAYQTNAGEAERQRLLVTAQSLALALETPIETILRQAWAEPALAACLKIAYDVDLFEAFDPNEPTTLQRLSDTTKVDPVLLSRILKHLAAMGYIHENEVDTYSLTSYSKTMTVQPFKDNIAHSFNAMTPILYAMPAYFKKNNYKNPEDLSNTPAHLARSGGKLQWGSMFSSDPDWARRAHNHIVSASMGRPRWYSPDGVDVQKILVEGFKGGEHDVLFVDQGGSVGRDITRFRNSWPQLPGRFILEDLPDVVSQATNLPPGVEAHAHDFFTPQPIKGAKTYYMKSVLHDWPDAESVTILKNLAAGMEKGYSKLFLNEYVVPAKDAKWMATGLDLLMMVSFSACERSEAQWRKLLTEAGFSLVKVHAYDQSGESLIEAELA